MKNKKFILKTQEENISIVSLNDDSYFNALSEELLNELFVALDEVNQDKSVKVIVIRGLGRGFSAGHNLKEIQSNQDESFYQSLMDTSKKVMAALPQLSKPVIAEVHGVATAAGCQLVAACDLAYSDNETKFATPGVNIGLFCHTPLVPVSRTISRKHSMEMLLLGDLISAIDAKRFGLINDVFNSKDLHKQVMEVAKNISNKSSYVLKLGKETFYKQLNMSIDQAYEYASERMIKNLKADDAKEGIEAFLEKRDPEWKNS